MSFTLALSGDSMLTRGAVVTDNERARALQNIMRSADVSFTNLEVVATDVEGYHNSGALTPTLSAPAMVLDELGRFGIDIVAFANNHTMNLGIDGMLDALHGVTQRGIKCAGVGTSIGRASMPAYVDTPRGAVGLVACTSTFTSGDEATRASDTMRGRPGLNPLRYTTRYGVRPEQLTALAEIHLQLGLTEGVDYLRELRVLPAAESKGELMFGGTFFEAAVPRAETACDPSDLARIIHGVEEAKRRSHVAVVSMHSHEHGMSLEDPAMFSEEFAHAVIDAGADVVVGHGPHRVRGIEIYKGKPIFYSLGNFVGQFELMGQLSSHTYDVLGAPDSMAPHEVVGGDALGFARHEEYWRSFVPVLSFEAGEIRDIAIHPVDLGFDAPESERGRPQLAGLRVVEALMQDLERLSARFGTRLINDGQNVRVGLT